ncbi:MAG: phosphoglycerate mutase, partial [Butyricicoccaceae bacterium]
LPYRMLIMPDHPTPIRCRTHTADPVPFMLYDRMNEQSHPGATYDEAYAKSTGLVIEEGWHTIDRLFCK